MGAPVVSTDRFERPLRSLRLSVTDRCNLRCTYCMPEPDYVWLPRESILTFEEIERIVDAFTHAGVDRVRITGGEPLLRRDLPDLIARLAAQPAIEDLALTTNGVLLASQASRLRNAGLHRITVSLDTLHADRFRELARFDELRAVLAGIEAASTAGFSSVKIDTVLMKDRNDDEIVPLIEYGKSMNAEVRFIEYMDVGGATQWSMDSVVSRADILARLEQEYGPIEALAGRDSAPAERFRLSDGTTFGIIASTTEPFCATCDRSRLTADGFWLLCLYARSGLDLRRPLREGATRDDLVRLISTVWSMRADRGAEERLVSAGRQPLIPVSALKRDAHLEMHTRGG
jgi:GTP 3',8-cyclase